MFANALARSLGRAGIHYGWAMVALAFLTTICWSAAISLPGILIVPIAAEFGWDRADVSGPIGVMFVLFACMAPFSGALIMRYGVMRVVVIAIGAVAVGLLATAAAGMKWQLSLAIGVCLGVAAGMLGLGFPATVAGRWFVARRGLAMGVLTAAFAAGQLTFLPAAAWLSTTYGWRYAVLPVVATSAVCIVLFVLFGRNWPSDVGLPPYGESRVRSAPQASASGAVALSFAALREAAPSPFFWMLAGTFFVCGLSSTGVAPHFVPFCADRGIGAVTAASYLALVGLFNFTGTIGSGWLSDRFDNRLLLAAYYGFRGLSLIWLPYSSFDIVDLTIWAVFFGLDFVATVPPTVRLATQSFGAERAPVLFGWIFCAHQLGASAAAYGTGVSRDVVLSYLPAFVAAGIACFVAVLFIALVPPRRIPSDA